MKAGGRRERRERGGGALQESVGAVQQAALLGPGKRRPYRSRYTPSHARDYPFQS